MDHRGLRALHGPGRDGTEYMAAILERRVYENCFQLESDSMEQNNARPYTICATTSLETSSEHYTTSNALPPASASNCTTCWRPILMSDDNDKFSNHCHIPMTSKNAFGSIPLADVKSVPVFFSDCIAARIPCTAATQDTREKTASI